MEWYARPGRAALRHFEVEQDRGLSGKEAERRLAASGANRLTGKKKKSLLVHFLEQLSDFMVLILIGAAALSFVISILDGEADFVEPLLIIAIVLVNAAMGVVQEYKAEQAIESLQRMSAPKTTVLRDGKKLVIDSERITTGDIVFFDTGDLVTADARILEAAGLRAEESSLTGESAPVDKSGNASVRADAPLAERRTMVFTGSSIAAGHCRAVVTAIGMDTEVGRIARMLDDAEPPSTPLQKRLAVTGKLLAIVALSLCGVVFLLGLSRNAPVLDSFMLSVSLAVAAVPEGLPAIVTIVLAVGVQRMARKNAIVRKLPAVETLGSATVICSDKTGTLTLNKMTVQLTANALGKPATELERKKLLTYGALCTNSTLTAENGVRAAMGDSTENAIVNEALERNLDKEKLEKEYPRIREFPFDSARKRMTTVHRRKDEAGFLVLTKGAPDVLVSLCTHYEQDEPQAMTQAARKRILAANEELARRALRVIAVAYKNTETSLSGQEQAERDLVFLGLIAMMDPPRPEVRGAVYTCKQAGIRPVMITGDHAATAAAIARELGILSGNGAAQTGIGTLRPATHAGDPGRKSLYESAAGICTGQELEQMSDEELRRQVKNYSVFARVSPAHKSRVVRALQAEGEIVAMTGDGVNDAPALKNADIGCAMGKTGTDVARDAADMILTDDNFATIVAAAREGRGIYQNICKSVHFLLSCNIGEILTILLAFLMGLPTPLLPIQLLWINLVTDSLPALAIGAEKPDGDVMRRRPIRPGSSMFADGRGVDIVVQGVMIGFLALAAFVFGVRAGGGLIKGRTYAFAVLSLSQLVHAFNVRSGRSLLRIGLLSNRKLAGAFVICAALQVFVMCIPSLSGLFGVVPLAFREWCVVSMMALVPLLLVEAGKLLSGAGRRMEGMKNI